MYRCVIILVPLNSNSLSVYFSLCAGVVDLHVFLLLCIGKKIYHQFQVDYIVHVYHFHLHIAMHIFTELDESMNSATHFNKEAIWLYAELFQIRELRRCSHF